nr:hypothetical protein [uncultured Methanoregula sp.]
MCIQAGESVIASLATAAGSVPAQSLNAAASSWACNRTDCPSYGKWWCPFTGW